MSNLTKTLGNLMNYLQILVLSVILCNQFYMHENMSILFKDKFEGIVNKYDSLMEVRKDTMRHINTSPKPIESILISYPSKDGVLVKKEYYFATGAFKTLQSDSTIVNNQ